MKEWEILNTGRVMKMKRININIDYEISYVRALWNCLRAFQKLGIEGGACTFHDGQKVNIEKNKNSNITIRVIEGDKNE